MNRSISYRVSQADRPECCGVEMEVDQDLAFPSFYDKAYVCSMCGIRTLVAEREEALEDELEEWDLQDQLEELEDEIK